jgi:hypothetical protein
MFVIPEPSLSRNVRQAPWMYAVAKSNFLVPRLSPRLSSSVQALIKCTHDKMSRTLTVNLRTMSNTHTLVRIASCIITLARAAPADASVTLPLAYIRTGEPANEIQQAVAHT